MKEKKTGNQLGRDPKSTNTVAEMREKEEKRKSKEIDNE